MKQVIGKGKFGVVNLGIHKKTGQQVAIKIINKDSIKTIEERIVNKYTENNIPKMNFEENYYNAKLTLAKALSENFKLEEASKYLNELVVEGVPDVVLADVLYELGMIAEYNKNNQPKESYFINGWVIDWLVTLEKK